MKRVLTVGLKYTGSPVVGVEFENLGLCRPSIDEEHAAFALYDYDVIIINPKSYSHFLFGGEGKFSNSPNELSDLKKKNEKYDLDTIYDGTDRGRELDAAIAGGTTVVWCFSEPKRINFFGYRETSKGYAAPSVAKLVRRGDLQLKKDGGWALSIKKVLLRDILLPWPQPVGAFASLMTTRKVTFPLHLRQRATAWVDGLHMGRRSAGL